MHDPGISALWEEVLPPTRVITVDENRSRLEQLLGHAIPLDLSEIAHS